jgi:hypothetical protein
MHAQVGLIADVVAGHSILGRSNGRQKGAEPGRPKMAGCVECVPKRAALAAAVLVRARCERSVEPSPVKVRAADAEGCDA